MNLGRKKGRGIRSHWKQQGPKTSGKIWKQDAQINPQSKWPFKKWITINLKVIIWLQTTGQHASPFRFMPIVAIMMLKRRSSSFCWRKEKSFTTNTTQRPSLPAAVSCTQLNYDEPSWRSELWTMISPLVRSTKKYELGLGRLCCNVQLWSAVLRDHLGLLSCNAQCSIVTYFSASKLYTSKNGPKYALITQAFLCRWLLFVKGTYLFQTQVRLC